MFKLPDHSFQWGALKSFILLFISVIVKNDMHWATAPSGWPIHCLQLQDCFFCTSCLVACEDTVLDTSCTRKGLGSTFGASC